jgi:hypothetical protein
MTSKCGKRKVYKSLFSKPEEELYCESDPLKAYNTFGFAYGGKVTPRKGQASMSGYIDPFGRVVPFLADKPVNLTQGGVIKWNKDEFHPFKNSLTQDNKKVILEVGSIVVPKPVIHLFHEFERLYGSVKGAKITDPELTSPVIVMPQEAVVPKKYAPLFKDYLKKHGVTLPLPKQRYF